MTRQFDSGLLVAFRTQARNGVIDLLSRRFNADTGANDPNGVGILKVHGGFLTSIEKLAGPMAAFQDEQSINNVWGALLGRAPAICVAVGDREVKPAGTSGYRSLAVLDIHLYFINNNQRGMVSRVEADVVSAGDATADPVIAPNLAADPGIDVMMEVAEELLLGQRVDGDQGVIKQIELHRETIGYVSHTHVIAEQRYRATVSRSINHNRGRVVKLLGITTVLHPPAADSSSPAAVTFETPIAEDIAS